MKKKTKKRQSSTDLPPINNDRVLTYNNTKAIDGTSEEKWMRLNEILAQLQIERCDLNFDSASQQFVGPSENSLLKSIYLLIQKVQNLQRQQRSDQNSFEVRLEEQTQSLKAELKR